MNKKTSTPNQDEKPCAVCKEKIKNGAEVCTHCSSYQRRWKNWITHIGAGIALLTFIASVALSASDTLSRNLFDNSIEIIYLKSPAEIVILNSGGDKVIIDHLEIKSAQPKYYFTKAIYQIVEKGNLAKIKLGGLPGGEIIKDRTDYPEVKKGEMPVFYVKGATALTSLKTRIPSLKTFQGNGIVVFRSTRKQKTYEHRLALEGYMVRESMRSEIVNP